MRPNPKRLLATLLLLLPVTAPVLGQEPSPPAPKEPPAPAVLTTKVIEEDIVKARKVASDRLQVARKKLINEFEKAKEQILSDKSMTGDEKVALLRRLRSERDAFEGKNTIPEASKFVEAAAKAYETEENSSKADLVAAYKAGEDAAQTEELLVSLVTARQAIEGASSGSLADMVASPSPPAAVDADAKNPKKAEPSKKPITKQAEQTILRIQAAAATLVAAKPNVALGQGMTKSYALLCALEKNCKDQVLSVEQATAAAKEILEVADAGTARKRGGPPAEYQALIIRTLKDLLSGK